MGFTLQSGERIREGAAIFFDFLASSFPICYDKTKGGDRIHIYATCKLDYDATAALIRLCMFQKADPKKRMVLWGIIYTMLLVVIVFEIILFDFDLILCVLMSLAVLMYARMCFNFFAAPRIRLKSSGKMRNVINEYVFEDNVVKVSSKSEEYNSEAEIRYSFFIKVMESTKYIFLFQNNSQVYVVDKSTVAGGTVSDIREKLSSFAECKYIVCNY